MERKEFNKSVQKKSLNRSELFHSRKYHKFSSIYDANTDNTIVILNITRATVYEAKECYEYLLQFINEDKVRIIIDMENVYFIDSVFFGTLIKALKVVHKKEGYIKLIVDYNSKPELLSISSFERIFETYPNLFEAVNTTRAS